MKEQNLQLFYQLSHIGGPIPIAIGMKVETLLSAVREGRRGFRIHHAIVTITIYLIDNCKPSAK